MTQMQYIVAKSRISQKGDWSVITDYTSRYGRLAIYDRHEAVRMLQESGQEPGAMDGVTG